MNSQRSTSKDNFDYPKSRNNSSYEVFPRSLSTANSLSQIPNSHSSHPSTSEEEFEEISFCSTHKFLQIILAHKTDENGKRDYLVKFKNKSYYEVGWLSSQNPQNISPNPQMLRTYEKRNQDIKSTPTPYFKIQYLIPEKILTRKVFDGNLEKYLVKWSDRDYDEATWESHEFILQHHEIPDYVENPNNINVDPIFQNVLEDFLYFSIEPPSNFLPTPHFPPPHDWEEIKPDFFPKSKTGLEIRPYQIDGVNFLMNKWFHNRNVILADEMGLGKTLQALMFLRMLKIRQNICGPFLIIVPLSTIPNWERETKEWTDFRFLSFYGSRYRREMMLRYEFFYSDGVTPKFQLLITTNDYIIKEADTFNKINWMVIILDEAHRLKNNSSKLFSNLIRFRTQFKVLLTGTPLQNNIQELWSLLHFLNENEFSSADEFKEQFGKLNEPKQIQKLQQILSKMMLRRCKGDVEKSIPPFEEIIIECPMTQHQKAYYTSIYQKNMQYLTRGAHTSNQVNLHNICMELRKCCNHPYLINGAEKQILVEREEALKHDPSKSDMSSESLECEALIRSSGKMILLDKLLAKLKHDKHRVLLFSQMVRMLDIIHDYLTLKGYKNRRIDGSIKGEERQREIDGFNDANSEDFVFLLCTKAGGVGINLTSADTVIIYDSDWNPQNDIQATARCHRIGQTKNVMVYRFITANSYELTLFETASHKLGLDSAVLGNQQNMSSKTQNEKIEKMIKLGAYYAFSEENPNLEEDKINEEDIDSILKRSQKIQHSHIASGVEGSTFSKIHFEIEQDSNLDLSAPDFWNKYIPKAPQNENEHRHHHRRHKHSKKKSSKHKSKSRSDSSESPSNSDDDSFSDDEYGVSNSTSQNDDEESSDEQVTFTKKILLNLCSILTRFGFFDLDFIYEQFKEQNKNFSKHSVQLACKAILLYFLDKSSDFPDSTLLNDIYLKGNHKQITAFIKKNSKEMEDIFKKDKNAFLPSVSNFFFLNAACDGCIDPPNDIPIPDSINSMGKPIKWWTILDDKKLLFHVWKHGELSDIPLTNTFGDKNDNEKTITPVIADFLAIRLKNILKEIRNLYEECRKRTGDNKKFVYNAKTLQEAMDMWTVKDQRNILSMICNLGPENLLASPPAEITKPIEQFREFVEQLINACKQIYNRNVNKETQLIINSFPEAISYSLAEKVVTRIEIFNKLNAIADDSNYSEEDLAIFNYLKKFGFQDLDSCDEITSKFGRKNVSIKLNDYIKEKLGIASPEPKKLVKVKQETYELPLSIENRLVIVSLGEIVTDRPNFHGPRYIYPAGFISEHLFASVKNPEEKVWYRSLVIDDGNDTPLFRVELKDDPSVCFEGRAPTNPWTALIRAVSESKKKHNMKCGSGWAVSGPQYFGFSYPKVMRMIQNLPGADQISLHDSSSKISRMPPRVRQQHSLPQEISETEESSYTKTTEDDNNNENEDEGEEEEEDNTDLDQPSPFLSFNFNLLSHDDCDAINRRSSSIKLAKVELITKNYFP